jgi:hypothetical protein
MWVHLKLLRSEYDEQPGVEVMIMILGDFRQFSAKKNWRFPQKPML